MKEFFKEIRDAENLLAERSAGVEINPSQGMKAVAVGYLQNGCLAQMDAWLEQLELN